MFAIHQDQFQEPLRELQEFCIGRGYLVATAESCTGGLLSALLTHTPGSSGFFLGGVNAYANSIKSRILSVPEQELQLYGAVSEEVASSMALGVRQLFQAQFSCSITGVAGPGGGSPDKPVGLVCFAWSTPDGTTFQSSQLQGTRESIRAQSCLIALQGLLERVKQFGQKELP